MGEFDYEFIFTVRPEDLGPGGIVGTQINLNTNKQRPLRRWKSWRNSDTQYPKDPFVTFSGDPAIRQNFICPGITYRPKFDHAKYSKYDDPKYSGSKKEVEEDE